MRRDARSVGRLGATLAVTGLLLVGYAGVGYARAELARDRVRSAWAVSEARRAVVAARRVSAGRSADPFVRGAAVARLLIPRLGLDEVVVEGVGDDELRAGPGHVPGSALPGQAGNAVLSAHRDRHFRHLDEMVVGDSAVTFADGRRLTWKVVRRQVIGRDAPALFLSTEPRLTLTTCWPVRFLGPAPDRLILTLAKQSEVDE